MYVPADDLKKISKISSLNVDCPVLECEDGVALTRKVRELVSDILLALGRSIKQSIAQTYAYASTCSIIQSSKVFDFLLQGDARNNVVTTLNTADWVKKRKSEGKDVAVRINSFQSGLASEDLRAVCDAATLPTTLLIPKIEAKDHIAELFSALAVDKPGEGKHAIRLIFYIESALALTRMRKLLKTAFDEADESEGRFVVDGVVFGSDDFCADIGATRTKEAEEVLFARQSFITTLRSVQRPLQAIDLVYIDYKGGWSIDWLIVWSIAWLLDASVDWLICDFFCLYCFFYQNFFRIFAETNWDFIFAIVYRLFISLDPEGLKRQSEQGARWGFTGKQAIHPGQIDVIQNAFRPSPDRITWAKELTAAFAEYQKQGKVHAKSHIFSYFIEFFSWFFLLLLHWLLTYNDFVLHFSCVFRGRLRLGIPWSIGRSCCKRRTSWPKRSYWIFNLSSLAVNLPFTAGSVQCLIAWFCSLPLEADATEATKLIVFSRRLYIFLFHLV